MIDKYIQRHEQFLEQLINDTPIAASRIKEALQYSLFPGGKRIRPIMVYLAGELLGIGLPIMDIIAAAIELTHCYSLIHDDLPAMDNDDFRRGKPSCHKAYDEATAILVGDGMQALAIEILLTQLPMLLNPTQVIAIATQLVNASGVNGMVSGQSLDLSELVTVSVSKEKLRQIHSLKTGKLILSCFEMVLAAHNTPNEHVEKAFRIYAKHIGLVFQMQDDYLDHYAPANMLGKSRSSDLANLKTTFATLLTRQQLEKEIATHYQLAIEALDIFGQQANILLELTRRLENRSHLIAVA